MNAIRRSHLVRIALLATAVLFSRTNHVVAQASNPYCNHTCSNKAAAEPAALEKKFRLKPNKAVRPPRPASQTFGLGFGLLTPQAALALRSAQSRQALLVSQMFATAPHSRLFSLRI
jgi:hypothetical protein